jgi:hypothetical protein
VEAFASAVGRSGNRCVKKSRGHRTSIPGPRVGRVDGEGLKKKYDMPFFFTSMDMYITE